MFLKAPFRASCLKRLTLIPLPGNQTTEMQLGITREAWTLFLVTGFAEFIAAKGLLKHSGFVYALLINILC